MLDRNRKIGRQRIVQTENVWRGVTRSVDHRASPLAQAAACLSGACAESKLTGHPILKLLGTTSKTDLRMAAAAQRCAGVQNAQLRSGDIYDALVEAQRLVDAEWSWIERLANALLERDRLEYEDVLRVLHKSSVSGAGWRSSRWPRQEVGV